MQEVILIVLLSIPWAKSYSLLSCVLGLLKGLSRMNGANNTLGQSISQHTVSQNRKDRQAASISCSLLKGDRSLFKQQRLRLCSLKAINTSIKSSSILISWHVFCSVVGRFESPEWNDLTGSGTLENCLQQEEFTWTCPCDTCKDRLDSCVLRHCGHL